MPLRRSRCGGTAPASRRRVDSTCPRTWPVRRRSTSRPWTEPTTWASLVPVWRCARDPPSPPVSPSPLVPLSRWPPHPTFHGRTSPRPTGCSAWPPVSPRWTARQSTTQHPPRSSCQPSRARTEAAALRQFAEARRDLGDTQGSSRSPRSLGRRPKAPRPGPRPARWAAAQGQMAFAFRAAEKALAGALPRDRPGPSGRTHRLGRAQLRDTPIPSPYVRLAHGRSPPTHGPSRTGSAASRRPAVSTRPRLRVAPTECLPRERRVLLASDLAADHGRDP